MIMPRKKNVPLHMMLMHTCYFVVQETSLQKTINIQIRIISNGTNLFRWPVVYYTILAYNTSRTGRILDIFTTPPQQPACRCIPCHLPVRKVRKLQAQYENSSFTLLIIRSTEITSTQLFVMACFWSHQYEARSESVFELV